MDDKDFIVDELLGLNSNIEKEVNIPSLDSFMNEANEYLITGIREIDNKKMEIPCLRISCALICSSNGYSPAKCFSEGIYRTK